MNDAQTAILEWQQKQLSGPQLLRRLVAYNKWNVPVSETAAQEILGTNSISKIQFNQAEDGKKRLLLYTDSDSFKLGLTGNGQPVHGQHFLTTTGTFVFQLPLDGFSEILIDPGTPTFIGYEVDKVNRLRLAAMAVEVEELIAQARRGEGPEGGVRRIGEYREFSLAVRKKDNLTALCYAPDDKGRKLVAIFTADDAYEAFLSELPEAAAAMTMQIRIPGEEMFEYLLPHQVDGLVFNCCGPVKPVAFAHGLCALVLGELKAKKTVS